jgi:hypothetical protein
MIIIFTDEFDIRDEDADQYRRLSIYPYYPTTTRG